MLVPTVEKIYSRLPLALQNVAISLKGIELRYRRASTTLMQREVEKLRESERWSADQFEEFQRVRLRELVSTAFRNVPYYRATWQRLGIDPNDIRTVADFRQLPELSKEIVRSSPDSLLNENIPKKRLRRGHTSGSTGKPMHYFTTREAFSKKWAFVARLREWAGLDNPFYPRRAQFTGRDVFGSSSAYPYRLNLATNALLLSTTHIAPHTIRLYADAIIAWQPTLIDGYPSAMLALVRLAREQKIELPKVPVIITTAETLDDSARIEIAEAFNGKVYNQYSASEPSCFWSDCEAGNLHIHPESGFSEIVRDDGTPASPGEEGRILMTTFTNSAMPLIRYDIGDRAVVAAQEPCPCGRSMPRVERVVGRQDDTIYIPGRGYLGRLDPVLKGLHGIIESQILQTALDELLVRIVPASDFTRDTLAILETNLRKKVGPSVRVRFELLDSIPRGPNGKLRTVVSLVRSQYPQQI